MSFAVSVIILAAFKSIDKTLAEKFPFSVATVIELYPAPGGPLTGGEVGFVVDFGVGLAVDLAVGVGLGELVGATVGAGVDTA